jgi:hypothetical protein
VRSTGRITWCELPSRRLSLLLQLTVHDLIDKAAALR